MGEYCWMLTVVRQPGRPARYTALGRGWSWHGDLRSGVASLAREVASGNAFPGTPRTSWVRKIRWSDGVTVQDVYRVRQVSA